MDSKSFKNRSGENNLNNPTLNTEHRTKKIVTCPLCGMSFDSNNKSACKACGKNNKCPMIVCPNCYHEFLPAD